MTTYNLTMTPPGSGVGITTFNNVEYKFDLPNQKYYIDNVEAGQFGAQTANGYSLTNHSGFFRYDNSTALGYYDGVLPLASTSTPTPDVETDAKVTSDLLRTTADGEKYYVAKAVNYSSTDNTITITLNEQEVVLDINPTVLAGFLTSSDITDFFTSAAISDFLTETQVSTLISTALSTYSDSTAIQALLADFLTATDLNSLTVDVSTTGSVSADIVNVGTKIVFADNSTLEQVTLA